MKRMWDEKELSSLTKEEIESAIAKLPKFLQIIRRGNVEVDTEPLSEEELTSLKEGKAILQFQDEEGQLLTYYPYYQYPDDSTEFALFRFAYASSDMKQVSICFVMLDMSSTLSIVDIYTGEETIDISAVVSTTPSAEDTLLNGIRIGDRNYKLGQTSLYRHVIVLNNNDNDEIYLYSHIKESQTNISLLRDNFNSGYFWGVVATSSYSTGTLLGIDFSGGDYIFYHFNLDLTTTAISSISASSIMSDTVTPV